MAPTLDERAEFARVALHDRYDKLSALWKKASQQLAKYHLPRSVSITYRHETDKYGQPFIDYYLGVQKWGSDVRIVHDSFCYCDPDAESDWKCITDCSAEIRREAVEHFPALRQAVVESAENYIPEIDRAVLELERMVIEGTTDSLLAERAKLNGKAK